MARLVSQFFGQGLESNQLSEAYETSMVFRSTSLACIAIAPQIRYRSSRRSLFDYSIRAPKTTTPAPETEAGVVGGFLLRRSSTIASAIALAQELAIGLMSV
jgi:hypothetical protein